MSIELTDEQNQLKDNLHHWFKYETHKKPYYSYSGGPGTGKTTVIKEFISDLGLSFDEVMTAAYVGKAVLVLLRHGLNAMTVHSLIYYTYPVAIKPNDDSIDQRVKIKLKTKLKDTLDEKIKLIIVDEATMINDKMKNELLSFNIPIIFIGDINQLPPVFGISSVMLKPDFILTKIMRQAEDDPIVRLCQDILYDREIKYGTYGLSKVVPYYNIDKSLLTDYDIIICNKNKTKEMINDSIRHEVLNINSLYPVIGDKLICKQNNWDACVDGIFLTNGLIGNVTNIERNRLCKGYMVIDFQPDFMSNAFENLQLDREFITLDAKEKQDYGMSKYNKFDYGYAITSYSCQGSEYDNVLYIDEPFWNKETTKKARYTAVSRAKKSITFVKAPINRRYY